MITVDDFKAHANITFDTDDDMIESKIVAASEYISAFLCDEALADLSGTPSAILEAVRILTAHLYENREGAAIPEEVYRLIMPYRGWAF